MMANEWRNWGHDARLVTKAGGPMCAAPGAHGGAPRPPWVQTYRLGRAPASLLAMARIRRKIEAMKMPVIASGASAMLFARSRAPLIVWAHGTELRSRPFARHYTAGLMRAVLRQAAVIVSNQPDHAAAAGRLGLEEKMRYVPTPIRCSFWRPTGLAPYGRAFSVLSPLPVDYALNGTDRLIRGFALFAAQNPERRPFLTLRAAGPDLAAGRRLAETLGIGGLVRLMPETPPAELARQMEASDCIAGGLALGVMGMTVLEAMALNRPVIGYAPPKHYAHRYAPGHMPPLLQAVNEDDVAAALQNVYDGHATGAGGRNWVLRYHDAPVAAHELMRAISRIMIK